MSSTVQPTTSGGTHDKGAEPGIDGEAATREPANFTARAARWSAAHRKAAVLGWLAFVIVAFMLGNAAGMVTLKAGEVGNGQSRLADQTLAARLRYWTNYDLLIIDEFGFDRLERQVCAEAPQLLYKVIDGRHGQRSTVLVTNVDFEAWGEYLGDAPLAMAFLDRLVDGAIVLKLRGRSYRAARARTLGAESENKSRNP